MNMDRLRARVARLWRGDDHDENIQTEEQEYEHLAASESEIIDRSNLSSSKYPPTHSEATNFSYIEYSIFLLLGVSMLWAWNMFLAAGPYFQHRFRTNARIRDNFQAAEISVSTVTNLGSMIVLTRLQAKASYPKRIIASLVLNMVVFLLLAVSTAVEGVGAEVYFAFLMVMVFATSLAAGLCQNGLFAYVAGFGEARYTQGIMTGQAVAGVLPCIAQIVSVLSVKQGTGSSGDERLHDETSEDVEAPAVPWTAALSYFLTATIISVVTLLAFSILMSRHHRGAEKKHHLSSLDEEDEDEDTPFASSSSSSDQTTHKSIPFTRLLRKLSWLAAAVFTTFAVTMLFPVFTQRILSVQPAPLPRLLQPASFIPLALLFWNSGDLLGRLLTAIPALSLTRRPRLVFALALTRIVWVGLYHLCNLRGEGAVVQSDFFYLVVVQLGFGLSNGFLGSTCMMGAGEWVDEEEGQAAGGFMGLCLVAGLTVGSLISFGVG